MHITCYPSHLNAGAKDVKFNGVCSLLSEVAKTDHLQCIHITFIVFSQEALTCFVNKWNLWTLLNVCASNYAIKHINTGSSICHFVPDRWTIGTKCWGLNRHQTRGQKIIYKNRHSSLYSNKYMYMQMSTHLLLCRSEILSDNVKRQVLYSDNTNSLLPWYDRSSVRCYMMRVHMYRWIKYK